MNHNDMERELLEKGMLDRTLVTQFLMDKNIDVVLSSPFKRARDTIQEFADKRGLHIELIENFRERKIQDEWIPDYTSFCKSQWEDFSYKLASGESLEKVQKRNIKELEKVLIDYRGKTIVVGSHGTALSTIINYYDKSFGYDDFEKNRMLIPWIGKFVFEDDRCFDIKQYDLFEIYR